MSQYKHTGGNDMISSDSDRTQGDLESSKAPAEALRQHYKQEIEYVLETSDETGEVRITYADGHSEIKPAKVLLLDDIMHFVDAYVTAYAATVEREAHLEHLKALAALAGMYGQYCDGPFGHDFMGAGEDAIEILENYKLAKEDKGVDYEAVTKLEREIDRLAALQGPLDDSGGAGA